MPESDINTWINDAMRGGGFGVWRWIIHEGVVTWSQGLAALFGLEHDISTFDEFVALIYPGDRERVADALGAAMRSEAEYVITFRFGATHDLRWMEARGHVLCDASGEPTEMRGSAQDVTSRVRNEQAIVQIADGVMGRQGEGFLISLVENLVHVLGGDIAFVGAYDGEAATVRVTSVWMDGAPGEAFSYLLKGTPCENVVGRQYSVYPRNVQALFPDDEMLVQMGIEAYAGFPLFGEHDEHIGLVVVLWRRSVPDPALAQSVLRIFGARAGAEVARLSVEAQRRNSLELLERHAAALAALSRSGVWQHSTPDAPLQELTKRAVETLRVDRASIWFFNHDRQQLRLADMYTTATGAHSAGLRLDRTGHGLYFAALEEDRTIAAHEARSDPRTQSLVEHYQLPDQLGAVLDSPVRRGGQVVGVLCCEQHGPRHWLPEEQSFAASLADFAALALVLSERQQLEEHLLQAQKMESIGRLAGGIAHDFNNLLTAISGTTELARMMLPPGHAAQAILDESLDASARAAELTSQLLTFARRRAVESQVIVLNGYVSRIRSVLQRLLGHPHTLVCDLDADLWPVQLDPGPFEQILVNLTVNARDAMTTAGTLTVRTRNISLQGRLGSLEPGHYVALEVGDTGCGIQQGDLDHIFEPFYTTKRRTRGTGLGLATCYGIVAQCGGHIAVLSEVGVGTTFTIYLPRTDGAESDGAAPLDRTGLAAGTETVLLVEDDPNVRLMASRGLEAHGFTVIAASSGQEALAMVESDGEAIDIVVSDILMPQMTGVELTERLVLVAPALPVLLVSGSLEHWREGDAGFLAKPYTPAVLARRVRLLLDADRERS